MFWTRVGTDWRVFSWGWGGIALRLRGLPQFTHGGAEIVGQRGGLGPNLLSRCGFDRPHRPSNELNASILVSYPGSGGYVGTTNNLRTTMDGPPDGSRTIVLAHGAGAPMDSSFMDTIAQGLAARKIRVVRFEFPYMERRRSDGKRRRSM